MITPTTVERRVFCIGLNKTGTTSIMKCFQHFGMHPIMTPSHTSNTEKEIIRQYYQDRRIEPVLEIAKQYKSFKDRPWNMWGIYRHLDQQYPDSQFILTIRDPEQWWTSTEHWVREEKPQMETLYLNHFEISDFSKEAMTQAYHKYNQEVQDYFADTEKCLVMDLGKGDGWKELCAFFKTDSIPDIPFPHVNRKPMAKKAHTSIKWKQIVCQTCGENLTKIYASPEAEKTVIHPKWHRGIRKKIRLRTLPLLHDLQKSSFFRHCVYSPLQRLDQLQIRKKKKRDAIHGKGSEKPTPLDQYEFAVVSCFFNPTQSKRRVENFNRFLDGMKKSQVHCLVVELAFGDAPFQILHHEHIIQKRTDDVMWHKERLLNIGIEKLLDQNFRKIAWLDGDILFEEEDWYSSVCDELDHANLCQVFSSVRIHTKEDAPPRTGPSAVRYYQQYGKFLQQPARFKFGIARDGTLSGQSGFGWAAKAEVLQQVKLFEYAIVGGGDKMMLAASLGEEADQAALEKLTQSHKSCPSCGYHNRSEAYTSSYVAWWKTWRKAVDGKVSYAPLRIEDMYHGAREKKKYMSRRNILYRHLYGKRHRNPHLLKRVTLS